MSDHLMGDLLFDLLSRISVKSLLRFRCVSKSWRALIDSTEFIKIQLKRSLMYSGSHNNVVFGMDIKELVGDGFKLLAGNFNSLINLVSSAKELYYPKRDHQPTKALVGACDGLLCIRYFEDKLSSKDGSKDGILLCNPWTRKHKELPYSRVEHEFPRSFGSWASRVSRSIYCVYGFGYDDLSHDYKVIRIVGVQETLSGPFYDEVKVYSLKLNSWKRIQDVHHPIYKYRSMEPSLQASCVHVNCALHWLLTDRDDILSIDLRKEGSQSLPLPSGVEWNRLGDVAMVKSVNLGVSNGCLYVSKLGVRIQIWLMKVYEIQDSWTKLVVQIENASLPLSFTFREDAIQKILWGQIEDARIPLRLVGYLGNENQLICLERNFILLKYHIEKSSLHLIERCIPGYMMNIYYSVASLLDPQKAFTEVEVEGSSIVGPNRQHKQRG